MNEANRTEEQRVHVSFPLLTNDRDPELDAMHIVVQCMAQLDGDQIGRILTYLLARYTRHG